MPGFCCNACAPVFLCRPTFASLQCCFDRQLGLDELQTFSNTDQASKLWGQHTTQAIQVRRSPCTTQNAACNLCSSRCGRCRFQGEQPSTERGAEWRTSSSDFRSALSPWRAALGPSASADRRCRMTKGVIDPPSVSALQPWGMRPILSAICSVAVGFGISELACGLRAVPFMSHAAQNVLSGTRGQGCSTQTSLRAPLVRGFRSQCTHQAQRAQRCRQLQIKCIAAPGVTLQHRSKLWLALPRVAILHLGDCSCKQG